MKSLLLCAGAGAILAAGALASQAVEHSSPGQVSAPSTATPTNSFAPSVVVTCTAVSDSTNSIACPPKLNPEIESGAPGNNY